MSQRPSAPLFNRAKAGKPKGVRAGHSVFFIIQSFMVQIELIGNLGADARQVNANGATFVTFNVAENQKVNGQEVTHWYGCNLNRDCSKLLPYLKKGQGVFVRGLPRYRIFDSAVHHCKQVAIDIFVNEIQLVGGMPQQQNEPEPETERTGEPVQTF